MDSKAKSKQRAILIDRFEDQKLTKIKGIQRAFKLAVVAHLLTKLSVKDDNLKSTGSNFLAIAALEEVERQLFITHTQPFLIWMHKAAMRLLKANKDYFTGLRPQTVAAVETKINNRLGIKAGSTLRRGGFLSTLGNNSKSFASITGLATRAVTGQLPVCDLKKAINNFASGESIVRDMAEKAIDIFPAIDRDTGNEFRQALGLRYAIYQGGVIKTSRPFCLERNDKVFTIDEIASWANLEFTGKSNPYNPFVDCGGYNCRHRLERKRSESIWCHVSMKLSTR